MPNLPGLTPADDPSLQGRASGGRVVPQDTGPDPQRLQPVAAPVDTYVRPAQPAPDNALTLLAASLSGLNPALKQYAAVKAADDHADLPGKVMEARLTSANDAEFNQKLKTDPALQGPLAQRLGMAQLGMSTAEAADQKIVQDYQAGGFNKDSGNLDDWLHQRMAPDLAAHKGDPAFMNGYGERFLATRAKLQADLAGYRTTQAVNAQDQSIFGASLATINGGIDRSDDPAKIVRSIQDQFKSNQLVLSKPPEDQAKLQLRLLDNLKDKIAEDPRRAAQLTAVIQGLANADRTGPDGKSMGSLLNDPSVGGQMADTLRGALTANESQSRLANTGDMTRLAQLAHSGSADFDAELAAQRKADPKRYDQPQITSLTLAHDHAVAMKQRQLADHQAEQSELNARANLTTQGLIAAQQGKLHTLADQEIFDAKGKTVVVTADEQVKAVTAARMGQIDSWLAQHPGHEKEALKSRVGYFAANPSATNDTWKRDLTNAPRAATTAVAAGGAIPPALHDAYTTYKALEAWSPTTAYAHTDDTSRAFYERAKVAEQVQHMGEREALALATRASTDKGHGADAPSISYPEFQRKANAVLGTWWGKDNTETANHGQVLTDVRQAAENLVKGNGLDWDTAVGVAAESVKKNYTVINGVSVRTADKRVPADFGTIANRYFDQYYQANKDQLAALHFDKGDLAMVSVGDTPTWRVVLKPMMTDPDIPNSDISLNQIYDVVHGLQAERDQRDREDRTALVTDRQATFYDRAMRLKGQVDAGHAINISQLNGHLLGNAAARQELGAMMANPDFAAGKALREKERADAAALQDQRERDYAPTATDPMGMATGVDGATPEASLRPTWWNTVEQQSAAAGVNSDVLWRITDAESGAGRNTVNPRSSARGPFQIIGSTWDSLARAHPDLALTNRNDPEQQARAAPWLLKMNNDTLRTTLGRESTPMEQHLAWFAGPTGAVKVLRADTSTPLAQVLGSLAAQQNPELFAKVRTAGGLIALTAR